MKMSKQKVSEKLNLGFKISRPNKFLLKHFLVDHLSAFEGVCSQMLEDVQERFVYRTHIYIREEILNYNPSPGDLSYPDKLEIMEKIAEKIKTVNANNSSDSESSLSSASDLAAAQAASANRLSPQDQHGMWFPTLRRTLISLSKLFRCLDKRTFEGLSQETLTYCIQSLIKASDMIKNNKVRVFIIFNPEK